jgi:hypothetical protein
MPRSLKGNLPMFRRYVLLPSSGSGVLWTCSQQVSPKCLYLPTVGSTQKNIIFLGTSDWKFLDSPWPNFSVFVYFYSHVFPIHRSINGRWIGWDLEEVIVA